MIQVQPITPEEAKKQKVHSIPDAVIEAVNRLLVKKLSIDGTARILQDDVIEEAIKINPQYTRQELFAGNHLDFEDLFRSFGWSVSYDKPGYHETYPAVFIFKPARV